MNIFFPKQKGFATLEILIAMAIIVMAISTVLPLVAGGQSMSIGSRTSQEALYATQQLLEEARAEAEIDFNLVNPIGPIQEDIYETSLSVEQVDLYTKKVSGIAGWGGEYGQNLGVSLSTLITNPEAINGGDTCSSVLAGDWSNPQLTEYEFGDDILGDTSSGFPITSIQSFEHKLYVTVNNDNGNNDETFFILDISNPADTPVVLGRLDNSPAPNDISEGLNAVAVDGNNYAYVANAYDSSPKNCTENTNCAQLQIIDIADSSAPSVVRNFKIPSYTSPGASGKLAAGNSIFYKNGIVYFGLANANSGAEFYTIDVGGGGGGGSPLNPVILGSYDLGTGINAIFVKGDYAYIASPDNQELKIFDISNPYSLTPVGGFDAPAGGGNNGNGKSLYLVGTKLYLGRTLLNGNEFYVLDNANPATSLPVLGSKDITNSGNNTSVNGIIVRDYLGFLITNEEFQIWNIQNPSNITQYANPLILPPGTGGGLQGTATDCEGNYIFVGSQSSNDKGYISVITSQP